MAHDELIQQVIQKIRSPKNQLQMSKDLGYSFNQVHKWESLQSKISWEKFCLLCETQSYDIKGLLGRVLSFTNLDFDHTSSQVVAKQFLNNYGLLQNVNNLHKIMGIHKQTVSRWLNNDHSLSLNSMLELFSCESAFFILFINSVNQMSPTQPASKYCSKMEKQAYSLFSTHPWSLGVLGYLELEELQNAPSEKQIEFLKTQLQLSQQTVEETLKLMIEAGLIQFNSATFSASEYSTFNFNFSTTEQILRILHYWGERPLMRIHSKLKGEPLVEHAQTHHSYVRVTSLTDDAREEILNLSNEFTGKIYNILKNQTGPRNHVQCLSFHLFDPGIVSVTSRHEESWTKRRSEIHPQLISHQSIPEKHL